MTQWPCQGEVPLRICRGTYFGCQENDSPQEANPQTSDVIYVVDCEIYQYEVHMAHMSIWGTSLPALTGEAQSFKPTPDLPQVNKRSMYIYMTERYHCLIVLRGCFAPRVAAPANQLGILRENAMDEWMNGWMDGWRGERERETDRQKDRHMDKRMVRQTDS